MTIKRVATLVSVLIGAFFATSVFADDCDPVFKGIEGYLCTEGRVEHKIGLKKDTRRQCIELKKVQINGCTVEPLKTSTASQVLYIVGSKAMKNAMMNYSWQCDVNGGNGGGGLNKTSFDGYTHPNFTLDKFPGESNSDRSSRFHKDLEKQGKYVIAAISIYNPMNEYYKKFDNQVCQYFNAKTNKIAFVFNCNVDFAGVKEKKQEPKESKEPMQPKESKEPKESKGSGADPGQGLKKLFGGW